MYLVPSHQTFLQKFVSEHAVVITVPVYPHGQTDVLVLSDTRDSLINRKRCNFSGPGDHVTH
jgi:3-deoxy-D-manno-octulosonic acid (KDO) 8-phosphate synthase